MLSIFFAFAVSNRLNQSSLVGNRSSIFFSAVHQNLIRRLFLIVGAVKFKRLKKNWKLELKWEARLSMKNGRQTIGI
jgi:hypothetical protein